MNNKEEKLKVFELKKVDMLELTRFYNLKKDKDN